uniref:Uncharacterized protein n=1 Tax=Oryza brachyantha TaxID=4533 RepID=J3MCV2_ORYBR
MAQIPVPDIRVLPSEECEQHVPSGNEFLMAQLEEEGHVLLELILVQLHHRWRCAFGDVDVTPVQTGLRGTDITRGVQSWCLGELLTEYSDYCIFLGS